MLLQVYLVTIGVGTFIAAIEQIFLPSWVAQASAWSYSAGWQREIGLWNVAAIVLAQRAFVSHTIETKRLAGIGFVTLNAVLGSNHLFALMAHPGMPIHLLGTVLNYTAGALGVLALVQTRADARR